MRQDDLTKRPDEDQIDYLNRAGRFENELVKYHKWVIDVKKITKNSARTYTVGIIQLFRYYKMPILLDNSQKKISKTFKTENSFPLSIEHIKKMYPYADARGKAILSLATDTGQRVSDLLELKIEDFLPLDQEPPIPFEINTKKENIIAYPFLSEETIDALKIHIDKMKNEQAPDDKNNPYLFPNKNGGHISDVWFNELIRGLASSAGIKFNGKKLSSHCFRKMFLSAGATAGYEDAAKKMVGKAIDQSLDTYYTTLNLKPAFIEIKKLLTIQLKIIKPSDYIDPKIIVDLTKKLSTQDTIINSLSSELEQVKIITDFMQINFPQASKFREQITKLKNAPSDEQREVIDKIVSEYPKSTSIEEQSEQVRKLLESYIKENKK